MKGQKSAGKSKKDQKGQKRGGRGGKAIFSLPPNEMRPIINKNVEQQH